MRDDPLAKWRYPGSAAALAPARDAGASVSVAKSALTPYKPFLESTAPYPPRLFFKCGPSECQRALPYGYLVDVVTDSWSIIGLSFALPPWPGPLQVAVRGEFMGAIAEAIVRGSCSVVEVFDKAKHVPPPDGAPLVREIAIVDKPPESIGQTKH